jgi:hypothetical protein
MMTKTIKLISNSGIQFENINIKIQEDFNRKNKISYIEEFHLEKEIFWFEQVLKNRKDDVWIRKSELQVKGFLDINEDFTEDYSINEIEGVDEEKILQNPNIIKVIKSILGKWIPIPFFKNNNINQDFFGPTDWVRVMISGDEKVGYRASFAIDTTVTKKENDNTTPFASTNINDNIFSISNNTDIVLAFLDDRKGCEWVLEYLQNEFSFDTTESSLVHIAAYQVLIKLLLSQDELFNVQLLPQKNNSVSVDMVIDVGNSTTCALLFEDSGEHIFNFNTVKKLEIQDLTTPHLSYNEAFSSHLVFSKVKFNDGISTNEKFKWPSIIRFGEEAKRLINSSNIELSLDRDPVSYSSSPKRYLWDDKLSEKSWEFLSEDMKIPQPVYSDGVTNHLQLDGSLVKDADDVMGSSPRYSRKSLMTFLFLEIYTNAFKQINSIKFRTEHGRSEDSRVLRNIVITCPTSMVMQEQINLRQASEDALEILNRNDYNISSTNIFPSIKELKRSLADVEERKDWIYDEATCAQLTYIYGMISKKYSNNPAQLFNAFGVNNKKELVIASVDIGGGTTDLMIASYNYDNKDAVVDITPIPLFWETFDLAGDDLLKELIQQIIIEGSNNQGSGIIETHLKKQLNDERYRGKLSSFFGEDSNNIGYKGKVMRKNFLNQISIPIMSIYLKNANKENQTLTYSDIFVDNEPCKDLLDYFENHFGFNFEDLVWDINSEIIYNISISVFDKLINQMSKVIKSYNADVLVLSGRTFQLNSLQTLFETYQPVLPNRMINMNNYWIGKWFPFSDDKGFVKDQKSVLSVGSLISLLSAKYNKMGNFRINTEHLKKDLISNANYVGKIEHNIIENTSLSEKDEDFMMVITELPFRVGFKKLLSKNYPARNLYTLDFNKDAMFEKLGEQKKVDDLIFKIRESMPLKIEINRDLENCKEKLTLVEITDNEENSLNKNYFKFQFNTLKNVKGYWLDEGEFILKL